MNGERVMSSIDLGESQRTLYRCRSSGWVYALTSGDATSE